LFTIVTAWSHSKYQPAAFGVPKPLFSPGIVLLNCSPAKKLTESSTIVTGEVIARPALQVLSTSVTERAVYDFTDVLM